MVTVPPALLTLRYGPMLVDDDGRLTIATVAAAPRRSNCAEDTPAPLPEDVSRGNCTSSSPPDRPTTIGGAAPITVQPEPMSVDWKSSAKSVWQLDPESPPLSVAKSATTSVVASRPGVE